jgi:hypothetical protein
LQNRTLESISPIFNEQILRQYSFAKELQSQTASRGKLCKTLSYKKAARKILMQLTPDFPEWSY